MAKRCDTYHRSLYACPPGLPPDAPGGKNSVLADIAISSPSGGLANRYFEKSGQSQFDLRRNVANVSRKLNRDSPNEATIRRREGHGDAVTPFLVMSCGSRQSRSEAVTSQENCGGGPGSSDVGRKIRLAALGPNA
jgi:hypothetical protein